MNHLHLSEAKIQEQIIQTLGWVLKPQDRFILAHIPNGSFLGKDGYKQGRRLQRQGVLKGIPDLMLIDLQETKVHFFEVKSRDGRLRLEQREILARLQPERVKASEIMNDMLYELLKNDFEDDEFRVVCADIIKTTEFYGAYPDPKLFYDRKPSRNKGLQQDAQCERFLLKVQEYLGSDYISTRRKEAFVDGLTPVESKTLQCMGGISALWTAVHRDNMPRSLDAVLKEARERFEECSEVAMAHEGGLRIAFAHQDPETERLIQGVVKHLRVI